MAAERRLPNRWWGSIATAFDVAQHPRAQHKILLAGNDWSDETRQLLRARAQIAVDEDDDVRTIVYCGLRPRSASEPIATSWLNDHRCTDSGRLSSRVIC